MELSDGSGATNAQSLTQQLLRYLFSNKGSYLETERGLLDIQSYFRSSFSLQAQPLCAIFVNNCRAVREMGNLLWLPSNYRVACLARLSGRVSGTVLVVGPGRVIGLDPRVWVFLILEKPTPPAVH